MGEGRVYDGKMKKSKGWIWLALPLCMSCLGNAQTLGNQALSGKYYFRHISLGTDGANPSALVDPRSLLGVITFDGAGKFTFSGQQNTGTTAAVAASGAGVYSVDAGGFVSVYSP